MISLHYNFYPPLLARSDIEVTNENGNKSYFSKVSKEKSGGDSSTILYC